ncbi:MAG: redoxin domain-containing protein [Ginsengibacter sp.]
MKKITLLFLASILVLFVVAQTNEEKPVYLRFPTVPKFAIYKAPDSTVFTREDLKKNRPVMFMIFSPDCDHCQNETRQMLDNIEKFKNTQIVMVTYLPYEEMIAFYKNYDIARYPQITMARDTKFFFPVFFKVENLPSIFIYDKKQKLRKAFDGDVSIDSLTSAL